MAVGTFVIDFGATPTDEATVTVSEASVTANSHLEAWIQADDTTVGLGGIENPPAFHEALSYFMATPTTKARVAGVSFDAQVRLRDAAATGKFKMHYATNG